MPHLVHAKFQIPKNSVLLIKKLRNNYYFMQEVNEVQKKFESFHRKSMLVKSSESNDHWKLQQYSILKSYYKEIVSLESHYHLCLT